MRTILLEPLLSAGESWVEHRFYCDDKPCGTSYLGSVVFLKIDEKEHTIFCEEFVDRKGSNDASLVRRTVSAVSKIPAGNEDLRILVREELGGLRFSVQTDLPAIFE